jgi:hypothetical protein
MPVVDSLAELNEKIRAWDLADEARRIDSRLRTVGEDFASARSSLASLPFERFDPGLSLTPRVDRSSLVTARMAKYSVPARMIGRPVRVSLRASEVIVFDGRTEIARHPRVTQLHGQSVDLDHYLEVLKTEPSALPGSTALAHTRATGAFTPAHEAFWAAARRTDGDAAARRRCHRGCRRGRSAPTCSCRWVRVRPSSRCSSTRARASRRTIWRDPGDLAHPTPSR